MSAADETQPRGISRRGLLGGGAAAAGVVGAFAVGRSSEGSTSGPAARAASYSFRGEHQSGIVTPAQDRLHFAAFDVITEDRDALVDLLRQWTEAADRMGGGARGGGAGG